MKKHNLILSILALIIIFSNCKKDDPEPGQSNRIPGEFTIAIATTDNSALISWTDAVDPDGDMVTYSLILSSDTLVENISETNYTIDDLEYLTTYSGFVIAYDVYNNKREVSFDFTTGEVPNNPPSLFSLVSPESGQNYVEVSPTFIWQEAVDLDGDPITYDVYLGQSISTDNLIATDLSTASFTMSDILESETLYYWKVVAKDDQGGETESDIFSFTTRADIIVTEVITEANFDARAWHSVEIFQGKMWLLGGNPCCGGFFDDVWYSEDGEIWTLATDSPGWTPRNAMSTWVYDDKLWLAGGLTSYSAGEMNDVWNSEDGITWTEVTSSANFEPRYNCQSMVYDGKMWMVGGHDLTTSFGAGQVWYSTDGITWEMTSDGVVNFANGQSVVFNDKMYKIGGGHASRVHTSTDGESWELITNTAEFGNRFYHSAAVYDDKIWVLSGSLNENATVELPDVWYSEDGITWIQAAQDAGYPPVALANAIGFNNKLWLIGGGGGAGGLYVYNHVWTFE